jgi:hypothetical protein
MVQWLRSLALQQGAATTAGVRVVLYFLDNPLDRQ